MAKSRKKYYEKRARRQNKIEILNMSSYLFYYSIFSKLAMSRYVWENVPDTVDPIFLERIIFNMGHVLWLENDLQESVVMRCTLSGRLDLYDVPITREAFASNGATLRKDKTNSVIIYDNCIRDVPQSYMDYFARRMSEYDRTIDVNVHGQKTPILILTSKEQELTMKNAYEQYDSNYPVIVMNKDTFDPNSIKVFETSVPFVGDKIRIEKMNFLNECLSYLGINNNNIEKRERLVTDEANSNLDMIMLNRYIGLYERKKSAAKINKMFGLNISVNYNPELQLLYENMLGRVL